MKQKPLTVGTRYGLRWLRIVQFAAATMAALVICGAVLWSAAEIRDAVDRLLRVHGRVAQLALRAQDALHQARRSEKDLLLNYRELGISEAKTRYLALVGAHLDDLRASLSEIRQLDAAGAYHARTIDVDAAAARFERGLAQTVAHLEQLGHIDTGLEGSFRRDAHVLEGIFRAAPTPALLAGLLQMRRYEKDFLLRARKKDIDNFKAVADQLDADLAKAPLPVVARAHARATLTSYRAVFADYIAIRKKTDASSESYVAAANGIEPLLESVAVDAAADAQRWGDGILRVAALAQTTIIGVVAAVLLLFLTTTIFMFRGVVRGVRATIDFAQKLALGDLDYRLGGGGGAEFEALADALNAMGDGFRDAKRKDEEKSEALRAANRLLEERAVAIQRHGADLEQAVTTRTVELEDMMAKSVREARDGALLNELNDRLQACQQSSEAATVISVFGAQFFPDLDGVVYLTRASRNYLEAMTHWGSGGAPAEPLLAPEECWGLRRGRAHRHGTDGEQLICQHLAAAPPAESVCVPLLAQGEAIGLLTLQQRIAPNQNRPLDGKSFRPEVVSAFARLIALAIANLSLRERLRAQSIRDPLTGLYNRRFLEESIERELARAQRKQEPLAVMIIDADHFKRFNDTFGHDAGDAVLRAIGHVLLDSARTSDIAARLGGEEFVLLMPGLDAGNAMLAGERLRTAIASLSLTHNKQALGAVTVSVGVAMFPAQGRSLAELLRAADVALYAAKQGGRNCVVMAEEK